MKKRLFSVFLALALCLGLLPVSAFADGDEWGIENGVLLWYDGSETEVVIPDGVTAIGQEAFQYSSVTSVTIPTSVTSIGDRAFQYCASLDSIVIPNSVTSIGGSAFQYCSSLASVTMPNRLTSIGWNAFQDCTSLTGITIPEGVTEVPFYAFYGCTSLTEVSLPSTLTSIGYSAFDNCTSLTGITIPEGVTRIEDQAFSSCASLASATLPSTLTELGERAFAGSGLTSIAIPASVTRYSMGVFNGCASLTSLTLSSNANIAQNMFSNCTSLTSVTIPEGVTAIGSAAFYSCNKLVNLVLPSTVTSIGSNAFNVTSLENVYYTGSRWDTISSGHYSLEHATLHTGLPCETHAYNDGEVTTPATCTAEGVKTFTCTVCGWIDTRSIAKTDHAYDDGVVTTPATCTADGVKTVTCTVCGDIATESIPATGHNWGEWADNGDGTHSQVCKWDSGHTQERGGHTYGAWTVTKEPTAGEPGTKERSCDKCGHRETDAIPATGGTQGTPNPGGNTPVNPDPGGNTPATPDDPTPDDPAPDDPAPDKPTFTDVPEEAFYADPVAWAVEKGITTGTSDTTFSPDRPCTRKEIVTFLWRAAGSPEPETAVNPFTDVREGTYYYKAVLWAFENDITTGVTATSFAPDASCTRWQVVTFLWRANGKPAAAAAGQFTDVASGAGYAQAVAWAVEAGITTGTSATRFTPNKICDRGTIVTFLYRSAMN